MMIDSTIKVVEFLIADLALFSTLLLSRNVVGNLAYTIAPQFILNKLENYISTGVKI